jgi:hypothetical protein
MVDGARQRAGARAGRRKLAAPFSQFRWSTGYERINKRNKVAAAVNSRSDKRHKQRKAGRLVAAAFQREKVDEMVAITSNVSQM